MKKTFNIFLCYWLAFLVFSIHATIAERHFYHPKAISLANPPEAVTPYKKANIHLHLHNLSIHKAQRVGRKYRPILDTNRELLRAFRRAELVPISEYLPQVTFDIGASKNRYNAIPKKQLDVVITQLLYKGAGPIQKYKIAVHETEISRWEGLLAGDQVQSQVEQSYLSLWQTQQAERTIIFLHRAATQEFNQGWDLDHVGLLAFPDWEEERARYAQSLSIVNSYQDRLKKNHDILERALGQSVDGPLSIDTTLEFLAQNLDLAQTYELPFYLDRALKLRQELQINEQQILLEQRQRDLFAQSYIPTVFVQTNITNSFFDNSEPLRGTFWQVALRLNWEFDGLGNVHRARSTDATVLAKMIERLEIKDQITVEVQTAYHTVQEQLNELQAGQVQLEQQRAEYKRNVTKYEIGEIDRVSFSRAQQVWEQAQFDLMNLTVNTVKNYRDLLFKSGYPDDL